MNHYFKCINIWHGASLRLGDASLLKSSPKGHKWPQQMEYNFIQIYVAKTLKKSSTHEPLT